MANEKPREHTIRPNGGIIPVGKEGGSDFMSTFGNVVQNEIKKLTAEIKDNFEDFSDDIKSIISSVDEIIPLDEQTEDQKKLKGPQTRSREVIGVEIVKISKDVLRKLNFGKGGIVTNNNNNAVDSDNGIFKKLIKSAIPLVGLGAGFVASIASMMSGGSLQGFSNLMSKSMAFFLDRMGKGIYNLFKNGNFIKTAIVSIFGKGSTTKGLFKMGSAMKNLNFVKILGKGFAKRLPVIGSIISLGSAWKRIQDGDALGGLIDVGAGISYMFPGVGTAIGIGLDVLNAGLDIAENRSDKGGSGWVSAIGNIKKWFNANSENIPIIGGFVRLGKALGLLSLGGKDNIMKGLKALSGAGFGMSGLGVVFDWLFGKEDQKGAAQPAIKGAVDIVGNLTKLVTDRVITTFKLAALGAGDALSSLGVPKTLLNAGLKMLGLGDFMDKDAERGVVYRKTSKLYELQEKRKSASTFKPRGKTSSDRDKIDRDIAALNNELYGSHDPKLIRSTMRGIHNRQKMADDAQAKRDMMLISEVTALNTTMKENRQPSNFGVSSSTSSNQFNFSVAPTTTQQQKRTANPMMQAFALGAGQ